MATIGRQRFFAAPAFWLVAAIATAARLVMVWTGLPETSLISDDAYYYFTIARHVAQGLGPTFDGMAVTNGFHPLWLLILTPLYSLFPHDLWLPVRTALSLTVLFDLISGRVIYGLLSRRAGTRAALAAAAAWFVLPPTALLGLQGMEGALSTLLMLLLLRNLTGGEAAAAPLAWRRALVAGAWLGGAGLARTDNLPTAGLAMAAVVLVSPHGGRLWTRVRWLTIAAAMALVVLSPWFAWNLRQFGTIMQVSGQVKLEIHELFGGLPWGWGDVGSATITTLHMLFAPLLVSAKYLCGEQFDGGRFALPVGLGSQVLVLFLLARAAVALARGHRWRDPLLICPAVCLAVHTCLFGVIWRSYATWYAHTYFAFLIVLAAAGIAKAIDRPPEDRRRPPGWVLVPTILLCLLQLVQYPLFVSRIPLGAHGPEKQFGPPLDRLQAQAPDGATLGAFDAGALGYVAGLYPGFRVVNLDGLVNNGIFQAYREGRYADWVLAHVQIVVQDLKRARLFTSPEEVERLRRHYGQSGP